MPLACLAFVIIGMPLGIMGQTSARAMGFAMAFFLIFLYYILLKWGQSLGQEGHFLSMWAIFSPNIVLALLGIVFITRTMKR